MGSPLADEIRPKSLDEVVGQRHILGEKGMLRRIVEGGAMPNMIFYGPSGVGKTTVAEIVAKKIKRPLYRLNATNAGIADIKAILADIGTMLAPDGVVIYLDEIQYFNKKQQQSLLEFMENGKVTLIASTTENPYFYVYNAVLSRATVFEFKPIEARDMCPAIERAMGFLAERRGITVTWEEDVLLQIATAGGGDVRKALNMVEAIFFAHNLDASGFEIGSEEVGILTSGAGMRYDRDGDAHYDILSAFQKSIRGSDPDAALHYLARLLSAGDLISPCRRLMVMASEDIGLAHPQAVAIVKACVDAANMLGLPEARIALAEATIFLATAPKSNSAIRGIDAAMGDVLAGKLGEVPNHLRDRHYGGATKMGHGDGYKFPHDYLKHYVKQNYLPDVLKARIYYEFGENKVESAAKAYWEAIK